jgi:cytoskeletal protein CcmA (bactofilin family)
VPKRRRSAAGDARPPGHRPTRPHESLIAADIMIEGKIEGSGSVRIAGRFKGDVTCTRRPDHRCPARK